MTPSRVMPRACLALLSLVAMGPGARLANASPFDDAVAYWDMGSVDDANGANSVLRPQGAARFGETLGGDDAEASSRASGDGVVATLRDATLIVGQGAGGEINVSGPALTALVRFRNEGSWDTTLLTKHGGHDRLQYNLYCFARRDGGCEVGVEIGTTRGLVNAKTTLDPNSAAGWHTVLGRFDGQRVELYIDGSRRAATEVSVGAELRGASDVPLVLGGEPNNGAMGRRFTGLIDHAAVWDRTLTEEEVRAVSPRREPTMDEPYRNQFHFSPRENWMNDPNGMIWHGGEWHLFYQYNPFGDQWGHMSWGHAVSPDMFHWEHLPVAIPEADGVMAFSGSAVFDEHNTSGLGEGGKGPLVAVYTGHHPATQRQDQRIAYSNDSGRTWTMYEGNPVIDLNRGGFRDPKVFWHAPTGKWVMVVSVADERRAQFYTSDDLKAWELVSEFGTEGATGIPNWECPELMELPIENRPGETRWVLEVDSGGGGPTGSSGCQYFVGTFDGERFVNDNPSDTVLWVERGPDCYAIQAFNDVPDGRHIWMGWMTSLGYAGAIPTSPWRGVMTTPREVVLRDTPDGLRLVQRPVREIEALRGTPVTLKDETVRPGHDPMDGLGFEGDTYEIEATFRVRDAGRFGFRVREGEGEFTLVGYDLRLREMFIDRRRSGVTDFHGDFPRHAYVKMFPGQDDTVTLRVLVDRSSVECYGQDGEAVLTTQVFPSPKSRGLSLFAEEGAVELLGMSVYPLESGWE